MSVELEEAVRHALDAGGTIAPELNVDLAGRARSRYLRRRRNKRALTAGSIVAAIVFAIGGTTTVRDHGTHPVTAPSGSSTIAGSARGVMRTVQLEAAGTPTVEQMWPDAILRLPLLLPNYDDYQVIAQYSPGVYVVQVSNGTVYRYTPANGELAALIAMPSGLVPFRIQTAWTVAGEYAVEDNFLDTTHPFSIWVADIASGRQTMRLSVPAGQGKPHTYAWADGALLWASTAGNGTAAAGIYSSRDPGHPMPGTSDYTLTGAGAWATSVTRADPTDMRWWNLATGERGTVRAPGRAWNADYPCGGDYCLDYDFDKIYVVNADGVQFVAFTGGFDVVAMDRGDHFELVSTVILGQDSTLDPGGTRLDTPVQIPLWDLSTGKIALVTMVLQETGHEGHDILNMPDANGYKMVLNLAAIH